MLIMLNTYHRGQASVLSIDNKLTSTKNVSRGHFFNNVDERFIQISGGKLTGFRLIAKESLQNYCLAIISN